MNQVRGTTLLPNFFCGWQQLACCQSENGSDECCRSRQRQQYNLYRKSFRWVYFFIIYYIYYLEFDTDFGFSYKFLVLFSFCRITLTFICFLLDARKFWICVLIILSWFFDECCRLRWKTYVLCVYWKRYLVWEVTSFFHSE